MGRPSERQLDWVLIGPKTPCVGAEKVLVPGLSTHQMVQCDPGFVERTFAAADPSCRCFRWSQLRPEQRAPAAAAASLALWWSADARLSLDGAIQAVWTALEGLVPSQRHSWRLADRDVLRAAWELDEDVGSASADAVQAWWQERQDAAYGALLRVEKAKLEGVALTSQTGRTLRLRPPKFRLLTEVSPDGVRFPRRWRPPGFQAELLCQAQELHCGHTGSAPGPHPPHGPSPPRRPRGRPRLRLAYAVRRCPGRRSHRLQEPRRLITRWSWPSRRGLRSRASTGCRPLVSALPGYALQLLVDILHALVSGTPSRLLSAVVHLCLAKKLPAWLVRNSRPVMPEPDLRRLETGVVQERPVTRRELRRAVSPEHFAHQRQLSGQTLALACRWRLAG